MLSLFFNFIEILFRPAESYWSQKLHILLITLSTHPISDHTKTGSIKTFLDPIFQMLISRHLMFNRLFHYSKQGRN